MADGAAPKAAGAALDATSPVADFRYTFLGFQGIRIDMSKLHFEMQNVTNSVVDFFGQMIVGNDHEMVRIPNNEEAFESVGPCFFQHKYISTCIDTVLVKLLDFFAKNPIS